MGAQVSPEDLAFYRRVGELLHYVWDPIGLCCEPGPRNEYDDYVPAVVASLKSRANVEVVANILTTISRERMGMGPQTKNAERAARALVAFRDSVMKYGRDLDS